jgi:hypothetical protein
MRIRTPDICLSPQPFAIFISDVLSVSVSRIAIDRVSSGLRFTISSGITLWHPVLKLRTVQILSLST